MAGHGGRSLGAQQTRGGGGPALIARGGADNVPSAPPGAPKGDRGASGPQRRALPGRWLVWLLVLGVLAALVGCADAPGPDAAARRATLPPQSTQGEADIAASGAPPAAPPLEAPPNPSTSATPAPGAAPTSPPVRVPPPRPAPAPPAEWWQRRIALPPPPVLASPELSATQNPAGGVGADQFTLPPVDLGGPLTKPGPLNTGVPPGLPLRAVFGDIVVTTPGAVLDGLDIHGFVRIQAPGVSVRRSIVRGREEITQNALLVVEGGGNTLVEDTELAPAVASPDLDGISTGSGGFLGRRLDIHGTVDGVKADSGSTIQSSWIHDLTSFSSDPNQSGGASHNDAVQILRGSGILLVGNTLEVARTQNSAVQITQDIGPVSDVRIQRNWVDGGGCTFNFSHKGGGPMAGILASENRFGRNSYFDCAILISTETHLASDGNVYDDTGEAVSVKQHD